MGGVYYYEPCTFFLRSPLPLNEGNLFHNGPKCGSPVSEVLYQLTSFFLGKLPESARSPLSSSLSLNLDGSFELVQLFLNHLYGFFLVDLGNCTPMAHAPWYPVTASDPKGIVDYPGHTRHRLVLMIISVSQDAGPADLTSHIADGAPSVD